MLTPRGEHFYFIANTGVSRSEGDSHPIRRADLRVAQVGAFGADRRGGGQDGQNASRLDGGASASVR